MPTHLSKETIFINTLVFIELIQNGLSQVEVMEQLGNAGYKKIEVRRELFTDLATELPKINKLSKDFGMEVYYSVPEYLYTDKKVNYDGLKTYFKEAQAMNCNMIKVVIGDYASVMQEDALLLNDLCAQYKVNFTVENDQTFENGRVEKIHSFLIDYYALGGQTSTTFDIGNWLWQNQDPLINAQLLAKHVTYIHLKDAKGGSTAQVTYLDEGDIPWKKVLDVLPSVPLAIEYPCGTEVLKQLEIEISKITNR